MMIARRDGTFKPLRVEDVLRGCGSSEWNSEYGSFDGPKRLLKIPDWVERVDGYEPQVFVYTRRPPIYIVNQVPTTTLGVGYSNIVIVEENGRPFKQMKALVKKVRSELTKNSKLVRGHKRSYGITDDGHYKGMFGTIDAKDLDSIVDDLLPFYWEWKRFPEVKSWKTVEKLKEAMICVDVFRREMRTKELENEIEQARDAIKGIQERIASLEKHQNEIYENAADAMNLLEENGVKVDMEDKQDEKHDENPEDMDDLYDRVIYDPSDTKAVCRALCSALGQFLPDDP